METITEDYVSFETAKLLKEKGFDGWCDHFYDFYPETGEVHICGCDEHNNSRYKDEYSMPTLNVACKWLRKRHKIHLDIKYGNVYSPEFPILQYWYEIINNSGEFLSSSITEGNTTYEEACEAGIKYCLENLL